MKVNKKKCIGCGTCVGICPVGAAKMVKDKAEIDQSICIHCCMCEENCPVRAIDFD